MPTAIYGGADATLTYSTDNSTYHTIAQLEKFDGPKSKRGKIDTPVLGSSSLAKLPGELDWGNISLSVWLDITDASHSALYDSYVNATYIYLRVTHPNTHTATFHGFITEWNESGFDNNEGIKCEMTFEVSGDRTNA